MEINATNRLLGGREGAKPGANESSSRKETNLHGLMERNSQAPRRRSGVAQACAPRLCALVGEKHRGLLAHRCAPRSPSPTGARMK